MLQKFNSELHLYIQPSPDGTLHIGGTTTLKTSVIFWITKRTIVQFTNCVRIILFFQSLVASTLCKINIQKLHKKYLHYVQNYIYGTSPRKKNPANTRPLPREKQTRHPFDTVCSTHPENSCWMTLLQKTTEKLISSPHHYTLVLTNTSPTITQRNYITPYPQLHHANNITTIPEQKSLVFHPFEITLYEETRVYLANLRHNHDSLLCTSTRRIQQTRSQLCYYNRDSAPHTTTHILIAHAALPQRGQNFNIASVKDLL